MQVAKKASVLKRRKSRTQIEKGCLEVGRRDSDNDVVFYDEEARQTGEGAMWRCSKYLL